MGGNGGMVVMGGGKIMSSRMVLGGPVAGQVQLPRVQRLSQGQPNSQQPQSRLKLKEQPQTGRPKALTGPQSQISRKEAIAQSESAAVMQH